MEELKGIFSSIDMMFASCELDYAELKSQNIDFTFFENHQNVRLVNSFLFGYSKIQDKIGAKLIKKVLYESKEIDGDNIAMRDVLNLSEKLGIIESTDVWDRLRAIRNNLAHEYPFHIQERLENLSLALEGYESARRIYDNLKSFAKLY